ncbi:hypothetical protein BC940DRAFT_308708 [Gongronella butleri]|nr:hypothetical protein BC940DRAFT_308708 [Gongronella butleri]
MQVIVTTLQVVLVLVVVAQTVAYVWDLDIACCRGVWLGVPVIVLSGMLIGGAWMHHKLHQDKLAIRQRLRLRPHASQMDDEKGANEQPLTSHDPSPANASPRMLSPPPCSPRLPAQPPTPPMLITDEKVQPQKEPLPRQVASFRPESMFLPESLPHEPAGPSHTSMPVTKQPLLPPVPASGPRPLQKQAALPVSQQLPVSQPLPRQQQPKQQPQQLPPSPPSPPSHPVAKRSQEPVPAAQPAKKTRRHRRSRKKQQSLPTPVQPPPSASAPTPGPSTSASASIASSSSNKPLGATLQGKTPKEQPFSARNVDFPSVSVPFSSASPPEKKESKKRHAQGGGSSKDRASFSQQLHTSSSSSSNQKFPPPPTSSRPPNSNYNNNNTSSSSTARSYYSPFRTGLQIDIPARDSALYTTPAAQLADYRLFPPQTTQPPHPVAYHSSANAPQLASSTTVAPPEATFNPTIALAPQGATFNPIITLAPAIALPPHPVHAKHSSTTTAAAPRTRSASVSTTASSAHPSTTAFWPSAYPPSPPSPSSPVIAPPTSKSWYPWQASPPQPRPFSLFHQHPTPNDDEKH